MKNILLIGMVLLLIGCGSQSNNDYAKLMEENKTEFNNTIDNDNNASSQDGKDDYNELDDPQDLENSRLEQQSLHVNPTDVFKILNFTEELRGTSQYNLYNPNANLVLQRVSITSKADGQITVVNVIANRGNCEVIKGYETFTLNFGGKHTITLNRNCDLLELQLETDRGNFGFSFE